MTDPTPTPTERAEAHEQRPARSRAKYNWDLMIEDRWQQWQNLRDSVSRQEARKAAIRLRAAAVDYGNRHGYDVQSRSTCQSRVVDLKFTRRQA